MVACAKPILTIACKREQPHAQMARKGKAMIKGSSKYKYVGLRHHRALILSRKSTFFCIFTTFHPIQTLCSALESCISTSNILEPMAYLLFKYLRRKYKERQSPTTDDSHLVPVISPGQQHRSVRLESLDGEGGRRENAAPAQHPATFNAEENTGIRGETEVRRSYRWKLILGLLLPNFLAAVDVTIVAPAVPIISSHFGKYLSSTNLLPANFQDHLGGSFNWIVAAYTLTFTTFVPCSGQIADIYGRHIALQFHMFWTLIGSVLCASSVTWGMLLFGRALQGLGAAGVANLTRIVLSDNMSLADNSKNNTIFSLVNGLRCVDNHFLSLIPSGLYPD